MIRVLLVQLLNHLLSNTKIKRTGRMNKPRKSTAKAVNYPSETNGSKWAAENRKKASALTDQERDSLFRSGLFRLYGGIARQAVRSGR